MKEQLYEQLRERIVKIVPEIMELKFGCRIENVSDFPGRIFTVISRSAYSGCVEVIEDKHWEGSEHKVLIRTEDYGLYGYKILGRSISLQDVLLHFFKSNVTIEAPNKYGVSAEIVDRYNLFFPLHLQEDSLGEWLLTVIK